MFQFGLCPRPQMFYFQGCFLYGHFGICCFFVLVNPKGLGGIYIISFTPWTPSPIVSCASLNPLSLKSFGLIWSRVMLWFKLRLYLVFFEVCSKGKSHFLINGWITLIQTSYGWIVFSSFLVAAMYLRHCGHRETISMSTEIAVSCALNSYPSFCMHVICGWWSWGLRFVNCLYFDVAGCCSLVILARRRITNTKRLCVHDYNNVSGKCV